MPIDNPDANTGQQSVENTANGVEIYTSPEGTTDVKTVVIDPPANGKVTIDGKDTGDVEISVEDANGNATKYVPGGAGSALGQQ